MRAYVGVEGQRDHHSASAALSAAFIFLFGAACSEDGDSPWSDAGDGDGGSDVAAGDASPTYDCDPSVVTCNVPLPSCAAGEVPTTTGACWSGRCVKASACRSVPDCTPCVPDRYVCVEQTRTGFRSLRCFDVLPICDNDRSCRCLQTFVCHFPFTSCASSGDNQISCSCPFC